MPPPLDGKYVHILNLTEDNTVLLVHVFHIMTRLIIYVSNNYELTQLVFVKLSNALSVLVGGKGEDLKVAFAR